MRCASSRFAQMVAHRKARPSARRSSVRIRCRHTAIACAPRVRRRFGLLTFSPFMAIRFGAEARRHVGAFLVDGFFNSASRLGRLHPQAKPERHAVEKISDIRYFDGHGHI